MNHRDYLRRALPPLPLDEAKIQRTLLKAKRARTDKAPMPKKQPQQVSAKFAISQPSEDQLKTLVKLKQAWLDSDGTSKAAAAKFNAALAPFGECESLGLFFLPGAPPLAAP